MPIGPIDNHNNNIEVTSRERSNATASTEPSKGALPKKDDSFIGKGLSAARADLGKSFSFIKDLVLSPFGVLFQKSGGTFDKPKRNGEDIAQAIFYTAVLPATIPATLLGAALMTPIALVTAAVAFATGKEVKPERAPIEQRPMRESTPEDI